MDCYNSQTIVGDRRNPVLYDISFLDLTSNCSVSTEHIIPESLGNEEHVLDAGVVCDHCNNYFALKVEKPFLNSAMLRQLRAGMGIPNKKGNLPTWTPSEGTQLPDYRLTARLIGKVGLEALAARLRSEDGANVWICEKSELDPLREFVRYNRGESWRFSFRTLYPVNAVFCDGSEHYQVLHEWDLLYTQGLEMYVVLAILGVEFALNLAGPDLEGYEEWLQEHGFVSPLYSGRNAPQREETDK